MATTVRALALLIQGQVFGDGDLAIEAARPLSEATASDITFLESDKNTRFLKGCAARAVVVPLGLGSRLAEPRPDGQPPLSLIETADPLTAFVAIVRHLHGTPELPAHGIDPRAFVDPTASIGPDPSIHPFAYIGAGSVIGARCRLHPGVVIGRNCVLGDDVTIHPNAVLYDNTKLGSRVLLHAGAILGADGFGFRPHNGQNVKVPQFGSVEVGDDVEIGAGTTIDRGTFQATRVGDGTKIDDQVMIGHNCQIGRHNLIVSQVGIAGSCSTGDHVVLAGQVGLADHVALADHVVVGAKAGVFRDVPAGERMLGAPARPERETKRMLLCLEQLPNLVRTVRRLQQAIEGQGKETNPEGEAA